MSPLGSLALVACALAACAHGFAVEVKQGESLFATAPLGLGQRRQDDIAEYIVGGHDATLGQFPHQASMQVVMPGNGWFDRAPQHICGGTLIAEEWVLTAAHCVYGVPSAAKRVDVVLGIDNLAREARGSQRIRVRRMLAHQQYDPYQNNGVGAFDVALLKLSRSARLTRNIQLAKLPGVEAIPTGNAVLSGWGSTSQDGSRPVYPNQLQTATFPIVAFEQCYAYITSKSPRGFNPLVSTNVCVGPLDRTGLSSCSGDSGGPLIQKNGNDVTVIGVVSWGLSNCGSIPYPSVFTRVSAFNGWIAAIQEQYA